MDGFRKDVKAKMGKVDTPVKEDTKPTEKATLYRVRKNWTDSKTQKGAFKVLANAKACADKNAGYYVFDEKGTVVYPTNLNIRRGPGTNYLATGRFTGKGTFTIVEVQEGKGSTKGWGRLKSGDGWISLDHGERV